MSIREISSINNAECMLASVTSAFLRSVLGLRVLSLGAAAISVLGLYAGAYGTFAWAACILVTVPVLYLMFRVELDAHLFERLAGQAAMSDALTWMDQALKTLGLLKETSPRPLEERVRGARRLAMQALAAVGLQLALLCAAAVVMALN